MKTIVIKGMLTFAVTVSAAGLLFNSSALAQETPSVLVNDVEMHFADQGPVIDENNRTLLPVRFISQVFSDVDLEWDSDKGEKGQVTIEYEDKELKFQVGREFYEKNNETVEMDTAAYITDEDRVVVPLRAISEVFDLSVYWNGNGIEIECETVDEYRIERINELNKLNESQGYGDKIEAVYEATPDGLTKSAAEKLVERAEELDLDIAMLLGLAEVESNFNPDNVSHAGALGLFQLMPGTAERLANNHGWSYSRELVFDPEYNIKLATQYMRQHLDRYDGDVHKALTAYNRGSIGANNYISAHGTGVSNFSQLVMEAAQIYEPKISE